MPASLPDPAWERFAARLPARPAFDPAHPLGCHRRRLPDRVVFEHVAAALVHGSGYEPVASPGRSDRAIRRRVRKRAEAGLAAALRALALLQYDRLIGLDLVDLCMGGCTTKASGGGETAGRSPVDRGKQVLNRSVLTDGAGVPPYLAAAGANRPDCTLLTATLAGLSRLGPLPPGAAVHLDRGYDHAPARALLAAHGFAAAIARKGEPVHAGWRWVVERALAWLNRFGRLRRRTERRAAVAEFYPFLAAAFVVRMPINHTRTRYHWPARPTVRRLR